MPFYDPLLDKLSFLRYLTPSGLKKLADAGKIEAGAVVVCTLTGHGLKDPHNAIRSCPEPLRVPADLDRVLEVMGI